MIISLVVIALSVYIFWKADLRVAGNRYLTKTQGRLIGAVAIILSVLQYLFIDGPWQAIGRIPGLAAMVLYMALLVGAYFIARPRPALPKVLPPGTPPEEQPAEPHQQAGDEKPDGPEDPGKVS